MHGLGSEATCVFRRPIATIELWLPHVTVSAIGIEEEGAGTHPSRRW